jgi:exodeoxyribonuclease VII large subunit
VRERLDRLTRGLGAPRRLLQERSVHVDALGARTRRAVQARLAWDRRELARLVERLGAAHPAARAGREVAQVAALAGRLDHAVRGRLAAARAQVGAATGKLDVLSPLASLARGYAIVRRADGAVVRDAGALQAGDTVRVLFARGRARARIVDTEESE